jgi:hypothetical protein
MEGAHGQPSEGVQYRRTRSSCLGGAHELVTGHWRSGENVGDVLGDLDAGGGHTLSSNEVMA